MTSVSILVPCFNAARYLQQTLDSAVAQVGCESAEILLWDDGSSDASVDVAKSFEPRIRVLGDGINRGGNVARNRLLEAATGEWLQFLDADDVILSPKVSTQLRAALDTNADVVYETPQDLTSDKLDAFVSQMPLRHGNDSSPQISGNTDVWVDYIRWGTFQTTAMLFRRSAIIEVGGWKEDQPRCQEHELLLRLLRARKRFVRLSNQHTLYRVVEGTSVSRRDAGATIKMRMALTNQAEEFLRQTNSLTRSRQAAVAAARLESARSLYRNDAKEAKGLAGKVGRLAILRAASSSALPGIYRWMAATLGFSIAERFAERMRRSKPGAVT